MWSIEASFRIKLTTSIFGHLEICRPARDLNLTMYTVCKHTVYDCTIMLALLSWF